MLPRERVTPDLLAVTIGSTDHWLDLPNLEQKILRLGTPEDRSAHGSQLYSLEASHKHTPSLECNSHTVDWPIKNDHFMPWTAILKDQDLINRWDEKIKLLADLCPSALYYFMMGYSPEGGSAQSYYILHGHNLRHGLPGTHPDYTIISPDNEQYFPVLKAQSDEAGQLAQSILAHEFGAFGDPVQFTKTLGVSNNKLNLDQFAYGYDTLGEAITQAHIVTNHPSVMSKWTELKAEMKNIHSDRLPADIELSLPSVPSAFIYHLSTEMQQFLHPDVFKQYHVVYGSGCSLAVMKAGGYYSFRDKSNLRPTQ